MQPPTYHTSRILSHSLPDAPQTHLNRTTSVHPLSPLPFDASYDFTLHQDENYDQEIVENSIQEPKLPDTILPDDPPTFSMIEKGTQRSNLKMVSSDGYEYTKKKVIKHFKTETTECVLVDNAAYHSAILGRIRYSPSILDE
ncbi:hypothetical protein AM593_06857, partial [Mytilus galloprovincialis]